MLTRLWLLGRDFLRPPRGSGVRDLLALFCIVQGGRLFDSAIGRPVNLLPSEFYGILMLLMGFSLLITRSCVARASYMGRIIAIGSCCLWLLLAFEVRGAFFSFWNSFLTALACGNEVRYRDC